MNSAKYIGVFHLLGAPQKSTKNRPKMSIRKLAVSTPNKGFGDFPSSPIASPWKTMQIDIVGSFRARTGAHFMPILSPNMSGKFLAVRFFPHPPRTCWQTCHESCLMMHHGWSCIIHDHESCISDDHESLWIISDHASSCIMDHDPSWIIMHHAWSFITSNHGFSFDGLGGGLEARTSEKLPYGSV